MPIPRCTKNEDHFPSDIFFARIESCNADKGFVTVANPHCRFRTVSIAIRNFDPPIKAEEILRYQLPWIKAKFGDLSFPNGRSKPGIVVKAQFIGPKKPPMPTHSAANNPPVYAERLQRTAPKKPK